MFFCICIIKKKIIDKIKEFESILHLIQNNDIKNYLENNQIESASI